MCRNPWKTAAANGIYWSQDKEVLAKALDE
jgi:hypothetical protein